MITDRTTIKNLSRGSAFEAAQEYYAQKSNVPFEQDLADYLQNGFVWSRPSCLALAKIIDLSEEGESIRPCWFIRFAYGKLDELLSLMPCYLPRIAFCRRNDGRLRIYDTEKLMKRSRR